MLRLLTIFLLAIAVLSPAQADPVKLNAPVTETGQAYRSAAGQAETDVEYYDPTAPAPELTVETSIDLDNQSDDIAAMDLDGDARFITSLIVIAILIGLVIVIAKLSGATSVSFSRAPDRARRGTLSTPDLAEEQVPTSFSAILAMTDRREALAHLTTQALEAAAAQCGFRIGRSWTLRDVIRRIPREWRHRETVTAIAQAAEAVHFGGRDIAEDEFQAHYAAARQVIGVSG